VDLGTDVLPALALGAEEPDPDAMRTRPWHAKPRGRGATAGRGGPTGRSGAGRLPTRSLRAGFTEEER
jgi:hypothetical protein